VRWLAQLPAGCHNRPFASTVDDQKVLHIFSFFPFWVSVRVVSRRRHHQILCLCAPAHQQVVKLTFFNFKMFRKNARVASFFFSVFVRKCSQDRLSLAFSFFILVVGCQSGVPFSFRLARPRRLVRLHLKKTKKRVSRSKSVTRLLSTFNRVRETEEEESCRCLVSEVGFFSLLKRTRRRMKERECRERMLSTFTSSH